LARDEAKGLASKGRSFTELLKSEAIDVRRGDRVNKKKEK
jgi:hypothetical protein